MGVEQELFDFKGDTVSVVELFTIDFRSRREIALIEGSLGKIFQIAVKDMVNYCFLRHPFL